MSEQLARLITLPEVFSGRVFRIPEYQRGYAWEGQQVDALLDDIELLFDSNHIHYTGTVVIVESDDQKLTKNIPDISYDIVDGQQRLTTFSILLSRLINEIEDTQRQSELQQLFVNRGVEGNYTRALRLNNDIDPFYKKCVIDNNAVDGNLEFMSEKCILNAYEKIGVWVRAQETRGRSIEYILDIVMTKFGLLVYKPSDSAEAGTMFEVINNRGKPLTELDKVKNYLVYYAIKANKNDLLESINNNWSVILKNLAKAHRFKKPDEAALLRSVVICFLGFNKEKSSKAYMNIKKRFPLNNAEAQWNELMEFVEFLSRASSYYECLLNERSEYRAGISNGDVVVQIELLRSQAAHASTLPLFFSLMERRNELDESNVVKILKMMEIVTFRVYMSPNGAKRTDSGQGDLFWLAHKVFSKNNKWIQNYEKESEVTYKGEVGAVIGKLYDIVEYYCDESKFLSGLKLESSNTRDFYEWSSIKYFLMSYEQNINPKKTIKIESILKKKYEGKTNDLLSIEHIWATADIIEGDLEQKDKDKQNKRRLGNFMLLELGINIQAQKYGLEKKVKIYDGGNKSGDKSGLKQVHLVMKDYVDARRMVDVEHLGNDKNISRKVTIQTVQENETRYIEFAKQRWSIGWAEECWEEIING